jgi:hypothetical protein
MYDHANLDFRDLLPHVRCPVLNIVGGKRSLCWAARRCGRLLRARGALAAAHADSHRRARPSSSARLGSHAPTGLSRPHPPPPPPYSSPTRPLYSACPQARQSATRSEASSTSARRARVVAT